jgi:hypothetical protein
VLAFSDEALARLAISATAVAPEARPRWLVDVAARLEREARRARGRRDTRNWRARRDAGRVLLHPEVDEANVVVRLIDAGHLDPLHADDPAALNAAAARALETLGDGSPPDTRTYDRVRVGLALRMAEGARADGKRRRSQGTTAPRDGAPGARRAR